MKVLYSLDMAQIVESEMHLLAEGFHDFYAAESWMKNPPKDIRQDPNKPKFVTALKHRDRGWCVYEVVVHKRRPLSQVKRELMEGRRFSADTPSHS